MMFWTAIRWGGTATIILLVLGAIFFGSQKSTPGAETATPIEGEATPVEITPADSAPPQNKNFNL